MKIALAIVTLAPLLLAAAPAEGALRYAAERGWRVAEIGDGVDLAAAWNVAVDRGNLGARRVDA